MSDSLLDGAVRQSTCRRPRPPRWVPTGALAMAALVAACDSGELPLSEWRIQQDAVGEAACTPPPPERPPASHVVLGVSGSPCDIVAVPVVTLRPSPDGSHPDPGPNWVAMTSDGRYYTTSRADPAILEWAADGTFRRAVGRAGEGPGELSPRGGLKLFLHPRDSLFVLDGHQRWTVFDPDLEFRRVFTGRYNGRTNFTVHLVPGRGVLTTADIPEARATSEAAFHLMNFDGTPGGSFGSRFESPAGPAPGRSERLSALDGDGGFWVVPPNGAPSGLVLERWALTGDRTHILERQVPWLPAEGYPENADPSEPRLPEYDLVHVDEDGLVWVMVVVRDPRWRAVPGPEKGEVMQELYDARMEVIDPASGTVLASFRHDGPEDEMPPFTRFVSGRRAFRAVEDSLGLTSIEIYDIHLVSR